MYTRNQRLQDCVRLEFGAKSSQEAQLLLEVETNETQQEGYVTDIYVSMYVCACIGVLDPDVVFPEEGHIGDNLVIQCSHAVQCFQVYMYVCMNMCMCICICDWASRHSLSFSVYMYICIYIYIYMYIYIYIYIYEF